jgi:hypothetical protein
MYGIQAKTNCNQWSNALKCDSPVRKQEIILTLILTLQIRHIFLIHVGTSHKTVLPQVPVSESPVF